MAEMWYYTSEGKQMEPVTASELKQLAGSGYLHPTDMVWKEGMEQWVKARTLKGLFPAETEPIEAIPVEESEPRPRRRRARDDDGYDDDPPRRRRSLDDDIRRDGPSRSPAKGMSGLTIGLIIGGIAVVVIIGFVIILVVALGSRGSVADYRVDLPPTTSHTRDVDFKTGVLYEFRVTSDKMTDVDLVILNNQSQVVGLDESIGPNSFLQWSPAVSGRYKVSVRNLDPNMANRSHVTIRNIGAARGPVGIAPEMPMVPNIQPPVGQPKFMIGLDPLAASPVPGPSVSKQFNLQPGGSQTFDVTFPRTKIVHVGVKSDNPQADIDLFVTSQKVGQVASDQRVSHTCRLTFTAQANTTYQFRVITLGGAANCTLIHTTP